jgi:rhodanese-related sulfurtransferase
MDELPLEIELESTRQLLDGGEIVLIDCREPDEYERARIEHAVLIPMSQWLAEAERLSEFAGQRLVVHCHHGVRSLSVTRWLRENGFPQSQSMQGGIDAWSRHIDPSVPQY